MSSPEPGRSQLGQRRKSYEAAPLRAGDLPHAPGPAFAHWLEEAERAGIIEPNGMALATTDQTGAATLRTVLLKDVTATGFTFFTNYGSRKAQQLAGGRAALLFAWIPLFRQVEVNGDVVRLPAEASDAYWRTRPPSSQLAAWASRQSQPLAGRDELRDAWARLRDRFGDGPIPRPDFWGGFEVRPFRVEFWQGQPSRMHDRIEYLSRSGAPAGLDDPDAWRRQRLAP